MLYCCSDRADVQNVHILHLTTHEVILVTRVSESPFSEGWLEIKQRHNSLEMCVFTSAFLCVPLPFRTPPTPPPPLPRLSLRQGDGSRKGNGACVCNKGYAGSLCDSCNVTDHYEAYKDETKLVCSPCHKSCDGACAGVSELLGEGAVVLRRRLCRGE